MDGNFNKVIYLTFNIMKAKQRGLSELLRMHNIKPAHFLREVTTGVVNTISQRADVKDMVANYKKVRRERVVRTMAIEQGFTWEEWRAIQDANNKFRNAKMMVTSLKKTMA